ncbi:MAG: pilin [Patescibacteria group bacterium]
MKKYLSYILILIVLIGFMTPIYFSLAENYNLLAPLPKTDGTTMSSYPTQDGNLSVYLNLMIKLFIGICAVLAVIMIVMGGIEYMTSELPGMKSEGKERIRNAIFGLLLALGAWTLLNTINPNLLKTNIVPPVKTIVCTPPAVLKNGQCVNP